MGAMSDYFKKRKEENGDEDLRGAAESVVNERKSSGGAMSNYFKARKEEDQNLLENFSKWSSGVTDYFSGWDNDYQNRNSSYHLASDSDAYRQQNALERANYAKETEKYIDYVNRNRDSVQDPDETLKWLERVKTGLDSQGAALDQEYDYWNQFKDEKQYLAEQEISNLTTDRSLEEISNDIKNGYSRKNDNQYAQRMEQLISEYEKADDFEDITGYNFETKRFSGFDPESARERGYTVDTDAIEKQRDRAIVQGQNPEAFGKISVASGDDDIYNQLASIYYYLKKKEERGEAAEGAADAFADEAASAYNIDRDLYTRKLNKEREVALANYESSIMKNDDFKENSVYKPGARAGSEHAYVNGYSQLGLTGQPSLDDMKFSQMSYATDRERDVINYLANTKQQEKLDKYVEYLKPVLNERQQKAEDEKFRAFAKEHPVLASGVSILIGPAKVISLISNAADSIQGKALDPNDPMNAFSRMPSVIRQEISANIGKKIEQDGFLGGGSGVQETGSMLYQTAMSMGDFLLNTLITGGFSGGLGTINIGSKAINVSNELALGIMGSGAAADALIEAKRKGMSDGQAWTVGLIGGFAEYITEKVSIEALLDPDLLRDNKLKYFMKNALSEGMEEVASDLINTVADVLVAQDASDWLNDIQGYLNEGKSYKEAFGLAVGEKAKDMGLSFAGGALSGGVMAGAGIGINMIGNYQKGADLLREDYGTKYSDLINEGLLYDEGTGANRIANELQNMDPNKRSRVKTGELMSAIEYENAREAEGMNLLRQAAEELTGKNGFICTS